MSRDHKRFAAELREDARRLRAMADDLDGRAADHERRAAGCATPFVPRRILHEIDEDACAFGIRYVGSSTAPTLEYT